MENPKPFDLNEAIRRWERDFGASPAFKADNLEELASHLRASVQRLKATGLSEEEAFLTATQRIGGRGLLEREYTKVNTSLVAAWPESLFWMAAGVYLLQGVSSLLYGMLHLRQLIEQRELRRLIAGGADPTHVLAHVSWFYYLPRWFAPALSILLAVVFVLGVGLSAGSRKGFGRFLRSFERPVRTALGLVVIGLVLALLPDFLASFLTPEKRILAFDINSVYGLFLFGYFETRFAPPLAGFVAGQVMVNVLLVSSMVWLARRALCKISPAKGTSHAISQ
jgi:hypothetical protein